MPRDLDALLALPGIGAYTARAVLVFAFEEDLAVVDTNIARVLSRRAGRRLTANELQREADTLVPAGAAWEWNQRLMDLGALVCTARDPSCDQCWFRDGCRWDGEDWPTRRQSTFAGSDRQGRGRLVSALRDETGAGVRSGLGHGMARRSPTRWSSASRRSSSTRGWSRSLRR